MVTLPVAGRAGARSPSSSPEWSWGQLALSRIAWLRSLADRLDRGADGATTTGDRGLLRDACKNLDCAERAVQQRPWRRVVVTGPCVDEVSSRMDTAHCQMLQAAPLAEVRSMLPDLAALVQEHLRPTDQRRVAVEEVLRDELGQGLTEEQRGSVVDAVYAAYRMLQREHVRVRSFRNLVYGISAVLTAIAVLIGVVTWLRPTVLPLCFAPGSADGSRTVVCPSGEQPVAAGDSLDVAVAALAASWDHVAVMVVGLVAAAVASAGALRQLSGTSTPYAVPLALAVLKLPAGALTAVLGLVLMRGQFVPGLTALDSTAQIMAWAAVFGYAQQIVTRFADERGQKVLDAVGGPEAAT